jgi:hypothetical protein
MTVGRLSLRFFLVAALLVCACDRASLPAATAAPPSVPPAPPGSPQERAGLLGVASPRDMKRQVSRFGTVPSAPERVVSVMLPRVA